MSMTAILFNGAKPFEQIFNNIETENPIEIWWKLFKWFQRRRRYKISRF